MWIIVNRSVSKMNRHKIDKIDEKIINLLSGDAKMSLREIAKHTKKSFVTIMKRTRQLEAANILGKSFTKVNYESLGYDTFVTINVKISKGKLFELEKKIASSPNVLAVYDLTGGFDALVLARFRSTRELDIFLKKIQTYDFVESTSTALILNTIKDEQIPIS
jgi:DNA-binding Lrp family transcriptional regulator